MAKEIRYPELQNLNNNPIVPADLYEEIIDPIMQDCDKVEEGIEAICRSFAQHGREVVHNRILKLRQFHAELQDDIVLRIEELEGNLKVEVSDLVYNAAEEIGYDALMEEVEECSVVYAICELENEFVRLNSLNEDIYRLQHRAMPDEEKAQEPDGGQQGIAGDTVADMDD
jgi:hypothetical protein